MNLTSKNWKSRNQSPNGFLALGVNPRPNQGDRLSDVLWQERISSIVLLEVIQVKSDYHEVLHLIDHVLSDSDRPQNTKPDPQKFKLDPI